MSNSKQTLPICTAMDACTGLSHQRVCLTPDSVQLALCGMPDPRPSQGPLTQNPFSCSKSLSHVVLALLLNFVNNRIWEYKLKSNQKFLSLLLLLYIFLMVTVHQLMRLDFIHLVPVRITHCQSLRHIFSVYLYICTVCGILVGLSAHVVRVWLADVLSLSLSRSRTNRKCLTN